MSSMILVTSPDQLRQFLPNTLATAAGELSLFDKVAAYLQSSEQWLINEFVGSELLLRAIVNDTPLYVSCCNAVVCDALLNAVPALDLVLSPNGFGIVSNNTIAPASSERVTRLLQMLEGQRDENIARLLNYLPTIAEWHTTPPATYFSSTLFPTLSVVDQVGESNHRWQHYKALYPRIRAFEELLAREYFSEPQMAEWRVLVINKEFLTLPQQNVLNTITAQIIAHLKGEAFSDLPFISCVNTIRGYPEVFPLWHASPMYEVFSPPVFRNKKHATGYWF